MKSIGCMAHPLGTYKWDKFPLFMFLTIRDLPLSPYPLMTAAAKGWSKGVRVVLHDSGPE